MWRFRQFTLDVPQAFDALRDAFMAFRVTHTKTGLLALFVEYTSQHALVFATPGASAFARTADGWRRSPPPLWTPHLSLLAGDPAAWDLIAWDPPSQPGDADAG